MTVNRMLPGGGRLRQVALAALLLAATAGCGDNLRGVGADAGPGADARAGADAGPDGRVELTPEPNLILYAEGVFGDATIDHATQQTYADEVAQAGYTTMIHAFVHVYPNDYHLVLNEGTTPLTVRDATTGQMKVNDDLTYVRDLYRRIKAGGKVTTILVSLGGGGGSNDAPYQTDYDFSRIAKSVEAYPNDDDNPFFQSLLLLKDHWEIDGIDLDYEATGRTTNEGLTTLYDDAHAALLARITKWATGHGLLVTGSLYDVDDKEGNGSTAFWLDLLLPRTKTDDGQLVAWLNFQGYASTTYAEWLPELTKPGVDIGVTDPARFVSAGFSCYDTGVSPSQVGAAVAAIKETPETASLFSAFLWQYGNLIPTAKQSCYATAQQYAQNMRDGILHPESFR